MNTKNHIKLIIITVVFLFNSCNTSASSCSKYEGNYTCTQNKQAKVKIENKQNNVYLMTMDVSGMIYKFQGKCDGYKLIINMDGQKTEINSETFYASGFEFKKEKDNNQNAGSINETSNGKNTSISNDCKSKIGNYKCSQGPTTKVKITENNDGTYLMTMNISNVMTYKFAGKCIDDKLILNMDRKDVEIIGNKFYASGFEFIKIE